LPKSISQEVRSLLISLLSRNPTKRLGSSPGEQGADEIMRHAFFNGINWDKLYNREYFPSIGFWPQRPEHNVSHFERELRGTRMNREET
jgi:serine/threonine protein kinase